MRKIAGVSLLCLAAGLCAIAQDSASNTPVANPHLITEYHLPGLDKKISLDLIDAMDVVDLIKYLCQKGDLNVILGRDVGGTSKLMLKEVTLGDALEIVLAANELAYEVQGNIIKIMSDKSYRDTYGEGFYERKQAKVIALKYAVPTRVQALLDGVKSSLGRIIPDDGTGNIILIDTPQKIREMEVVIQKAELPSIQRIVPTVTTNFVLQYAKIEDVKRELLVLLTKDIGQIQSDTRTKTLIVTDVPAAMPKLCNLVGLFDRVQKQVFIEAKIVQVTLSDSLSLGVNWDHIFQGLDPRFSLQTISKNAALAAAGDGGTINFHTIAAGGDLNVVVNALKTVGRTKLLQNPHISTLDGQEATIKAITSQPYAETQRESGTTNITGTTYKFIDVGITLAVTPHINELGFITCEIRPEVSNVLDWYDSDSRGKVNSGVPVVQKSYAETSVSVKDGVTIIIAGMIDETERKSRTQIPILGSIPVLGALFRYDEVKTEKVETIVLLTPRIVTGAKFFERSKDMMKPAKSDGVAEKGLVGSDMTP